MLSFLYSDDIIIHCQWGWIMSSTDENQFRQINVQPLKFVDGGTSNWMVRCKQNWIKLYSANNSLGFFSFIFRFSHCDLKASKSRTRCKSVATFFFHGIEYDGKEIEKKTESTMNFVSKKYWNEWNFKRENQVMMITILPSSNIVWQTWGNWIHTYREWEWETW